MIAAAQRVLTFKGRCSRLAYWREVLAANALAAVLSCLTIFGVIHFGPIAIIAFLGLLPLLAWSVAAGVRRLHDRDRGGAWLLVFWLGPWLLFAAAEGLTHSADATEIWIAAGLSLVGFALSLWGFVEIGLLKGTKGRNSYDPSPVRKPDPPPLTHADDIFPPLFRG